MSKFNSWFRDPSLVLYNKYYEADEEVTQFMRENCQFLGILFGSFRNKGTKHFLTYLNKFYRYIQQRDEPFDVIYVPLDEDEPECEYFVNACMEEWLVIPWSNQNLRRNVRNLYNVLAQPSLVIVRNDDDGTVVSYEGKTDLLECGYFALIEWKQNYKDILKEFKEGGLKGLAKKTTKPNANAGNEEEDDDVVAPTPSRPPPKAIEEKKEEPAGETTEPADAAPAEA